MNLDELHTLYEHIVRLKKLKRAGWVRNNIEAPESVADHSFALAVLTLHYAEKLNLDTYKAVTIAVLHDIGESVIGDITPHDGVKGEDKTQKESAAVREILNNDDLYQLWLDFEQGRTAEGRLVRQLDKIEAFLQAKSYQAKPEVIEEFLNSSLKATSDPLLKKILET